MRIARHRWTTTRIRVPSVALMRLAALMLMQPRWARAAPDTRFTMQPPQTIIAREIYDLHGIVLGICILIAVAVFAVMLYSIFKFRKSGERQASQFSSSTPLEITWTVIPCLIVAGMAYLATRTVVLRQPALTVDEWQTEIKKMQSAFGAPIPADQVDALARYLGEINGRKSDSKPPTVDKQAS